MALPSQEYWQMRALELEKEVRLKGDQLEKELERQFLLALDDIKTQLEAFFAKYASEHGLTYAEAQKLLTPIEAGEFANRMRALQGEWQRTGNPRLLAEIDQLNARAKVTRLQALMTQIVARIGLLTHYVESEVTSYLRDTYQLGYYRTSFNIQTGFGVGAIVPKLNEEAIMTAITYPWSGEMFSERIWANRDKLVQVLRQTIVQGIIQGQSIQRMTKTLKEKMNASRSNAERIIRTESTFALTEGTARSYEANGVEKYEFLAVLDRRTSQICRSLDGKVFPVKDRVIGVNAPPMHPRCRSTIMPYFDNIDRAAEQRRANIDGQSVIIQNMTYDEWYNRFVR